jgi:predicted regulator of Ras-like GTPase activity (Roadblock/LC7/MglB family)
LRNIVSELSFRPSINQMTQLDQALLGLKSHEGVEHLLLVGTDGLLIRHVGEADGVSADTVAAMVPGVVAAAGALARSVGGDQASTAVLELDDGVAIVTTLSPEMLLAILVRSGVGFTSLLRELRRERGRLAELV